MGDYKINYYGGSGSSYGLKENENPDFSSPFGHNVYAGEFSVSTDPRTNNQIKAVSEKLNTGLKAVELSMLTPDVAEAIPNQHLVELNRLRKLTGVDLTVHGPLVEPTGVIQNHWDETQRKQAEMQILDSVKRAQKVDPTGNVVVTIHASNGLPEPETRIMENGKQVIDNITVVNERTGEVGRLPKPRSNWFEGKENPNPEDELTRINEENWSRTLSNLSITASRAGEIFNKRLGGELADLTEKYGLSTVGELIKAYRDPEGKKFIKSSEKEEQKIASEISGSLSYANAFVTDSYIAFKELYNQAYDVAKQNNNKNVQAKLDELREEVTETVKAYGNDNSQVMELSDVVRKGIQTLEEIKQIPQTYKPIKQFAIDKSAETFGNVAFQAYEDARSRKEEAPIISIENPPAGMGISRAEELKEVVENARRVFERRAQASGMSEEESKKQAEKLIGATWDVGHINMIRKYGYGDKELQEQSKTIAPYVKHVHLSDNFGFEHTELPMGMGNVPMKEHLAKLSKGYEEQFAKVKKVIEVGNWYQNFQTTPFTETLAAFGSPIYGMKMAPYWNQAVQTQGGYFAGYGMNPEVHHSVYGAGFSNLPVELGGQMAGRSRISGAPTD